MEIGFDGGPEASAAHTMQALAAENVTLFEATLISGNKLARADILKKTGNRFDLIEVKATSIDEADAALFQGRNGIRAEWQPYLEDVAFQAHVLAELFPSAVVVPYLCLVDKSKTTTIESIHSCFELTQPAPTGTFRRPSVRFTGNVESLRQDHLLATVDVQAEVNELMAMIIKESERFAASLRGDMTRIPTEFNVNCRACQYRIEPAADAAKDGFRECWGPLADASPHILDMYHVSSIGGRGGPTVNALLHRGRARLADLDEADLAQGDGAVGPVAQRQRLQREYALRNEEFISEELPGLLRSHAYPPHVIDFETSRVAVPYHANMRPYEQVAFQWSCHTISEPGATAVHSEWINLDDAYPNFDFANSLQVQLGDRGTAYTWSPHENTVLKDIVEQMSHYGVSDEPLQAWLEMITAVSGQLRIVDLCAVAKEHYFHPLMKGRLSIKFVLPAVWSTDAALHRDPWTV